MIEFYFHYVNRATSLINAEKGKLNFQSEVKDHIHDFMEKIDFICHSIVIYIMQF